MGPSAFFLFLSLCVAGASDPNSQNLEGVLDEEKALYDKYIELDNSAKVLVNAGLKTVLPYILELSQDLNISSGCARDVFKLISDVKKLKISAFKMLDAMGKLSAGALKFNIIMLGDYDECLATETATYRGKYCMVYIKPKLPPRRETVTLKKGIQGLMRTTQNTSEVMQFIAEKLQFMYRYEARLGVCIPSGCKVEDVNSVAKYIGEKTILNARVGYCKGIEEEPMSTGKIIAIFFFSLFGLLAALGTAFDHYARKKNINFKSFLAKLLLCFSLLENFPKVVSAETNDKSLTSLFGIRALSLFYIVLIHHYFFVEKFFVQANMIRFKDLIPTFFIQIIINGFLTTEVFIFLGGFVHAYSVLQYMKKSKRKISYVSMLTHRLLRIYPAYLFAIMSIYIMRDVNGPLAPLVEQTYWVNCDRYWWYNLIFINNFFNQEDTCLFHGWYIAVDMHLFLMSMFTVPLLAKNPKKGVAIHLGIIAIGLLSTSLWAWHKNILPALVLFRVHTDEIYKVWNAYTTTFPHIAPYFAGVLFGYFVLAYKDIKIPWVYRLFGWPLAGVAFTSMLFLTQRWNSGVEPSVVTSVLYFSFSRIIYVIAVGWMIFCCATGCGGVVNYILSLKVWIPISRISYMMFLISPIVQTIYISHLKIVIDSDSISLIWRFFGDLVASFLLALVMTTIFESPFVALQKIIFESKKDVESDRQDQVDIEKVPTSTELENNYKNTIFHLQQKDGNFTKF